MDPIANMLTIIRNAQAVGKPTVVVPFSGIKYELAKILQQNSFVNDVKKLKQKGKPIIAIELKYNQGGPGIREIKKISKPGQRIYSSSKGLRPVKQGFGLAIISTSKGLMSDRDARRQKIGGEILCQLW